MFSDTVPNVEQAVEALSRCALETDFMQQTIATAQADEHLTLKQIWCLLNVNPQQQRAEWNTLLHLSQSRKRASYQERVFAIVPLYVTSVCQEHCVYCNFRAENKGNEIARLRLTHHELEQEARFLIEERGLRVIELVYATDPKMRVPQIGEHLQLVHELLREVGGGMVGINAEPFDEEEYRQLKAAGLDFAVCWQETYQRAAYHDLHPGTTKKASFDYRVNAAERMMRAGVSRFGLGVLSGLADWRRDWLFLIAHELYLKERYGISPTILGVPRLKPAPGAQLHMTPFIPTDEEYLLAVAVHNLIFPDALPFVNTREDWNLCVQTASGGGALFTFDCKTIPGGYTLGKQGYQFPTSSYDTSSYAQRIEASGLHPIFHWSFDGVQA